MDKEEVLKIIMVETDNGFYMKENRVNVRRFYGSRIPNLYFDKELPKETHLAGWYRIEKYPKKIQKKERDTREDKYWKLKNPDMVSKALPMKKNYDDLDYDDSTIVDLYELNYTLVPGGFVDVPYEIETVLKVEGFTLPRVVKFQAESENNRCYTITEANFESQWLDKLIYPEIVLHQLPARVTSKQMYDIVRHHIKQNIDLEYARISSDYDFCFSVEKRAKIDAPGKIHHSTEENINFIIGDEISRFGNYEVFEMTHDQENYKKYTPIKGLTADNMELLAEKIQTYLDELIELINMPTVKMI